MNTPPNYAELIPLHEIKTYLRLDHDKEDELLLNATKAAINLIEKYTNLILTVQSQELTIKELHNHNITLPIAPVTAINTVLINNRLINEYSFKAEKIKLPYWSLNCQVTINYQVGYNAANFPPELKMIILAYIAAIYNRNYDNATIENILRALSPYKIYKLTNDEAV